MSSDLSVYCVRKASRSDVSLFHEIQCRAFEERWHESLELFQEVYDFYPEGAFVLEHDQKAMGYAFVHPADDDRTDYEEAGWDIRGDETCLFIHDLCVDPNYQGQGAAQQLFNYVEGFAKQKGFNSLIGVAISGVERFWEKQGFTMLRPYLYNGEQATFMEKVLP